MQVISVGVKGLGVGAAAGLLVVLAALPARAERFIPIGARQRALGGAGVASSEDATAIYWNPANLSLLPLNRPSYTVKKKRVEEALRRGKEAAEGKTSTAAVEREPGEEREEKVEGADKWEGYDTFQFEIVANAELKLTGDIVTRLDRLDDLIEDSDIAGAAERANNLTITQQDFRNLVRFYDELEALDEGGDGIAEIGGGLFSRYCSLGLALYTNTWIGLRPEVSLANQAGFSDTTIIKQIDDQLRTLGAIPAPSTPGGQQLQADLFTALVSSGMAPGDATNVSNDIAGLAEQSGVDLSDPDLRDAIRIATEQTGAGTGILNNPTGAKAKALSTQELALAFGFDYAELIALGTSLKLMHGITSIEEVRIVDALTGGESFGDIADRFDRNRESSFQFGIDAGATVQPTRWLRVSAVGRNLNTPRFKFKYGGTFELRPQYRGGLAVRPIPSLMLTVDADLTVNRSQALSGFRSRLIGGGIEWNPDWSFAGLAIRAGCYGDLEDPRPEFRPILTGGVGLKLAIVTIDLAGSVSFRRERFRDHDIPSDIGLAAQVGLSW